MNKEFIPYEEALALKELGFDLDCNGCWVVNKAHPTPVLAFSDSWMNHNNGENLISAPLYQQAFRLFREKHGLYGGVFPLNDDDTILWQFNIHPYKKMVEGSYKGIDDGLPSNRSYHERELACLRKLIEIVKEK